MKIVKPALLAFVVCITIMSAIGFDTLLGSSANKLPFPMLGGNDNQGEGNTHKCIVRRFECGKDPLPSCFKRWRSKEISCNDSSCTSGFCMPYTVFLSKYTFQQWDKEDLQGPFPRTETMCIMQQSACPLDDESCISSISLLQVSCEVEFCSGTACIHKSVLVDKNDAVINVTIIPTENDDRNEDDTDDDRNDDQCDNGANGGQRCGNTTGNTVSPTQKIALGCFDGAGAWGTDRTRCSQNQKLYVQPNNEDTHESGAKTVIAKEEEEKKIQQKIEVIFVPDTSKSSLVQSLLTTITEADGRIGTILSNIALSETVRTNLIKEREILSTLKHAVSEPNQSMQNLQQLGESISKHIQSIQFLVQSLQSDQKPPTTITEKLDAIFTGLPEVFSLLLEEGIPVDNVMISGYIGAEGAYSPLKETCHSTVTSCGDLVEIIDALQPVFVSLQKSLEKAGRTDLQGEIDELLRQ